MFKAYNLYTKLLCKAPTLSWTPWLSGLEQFWTLFWTSWSSPFSSSNYNYDMRMMIKILFHSGREMVLDSGTLGPWAATPDIALWAVMMKVSKWQQQIMEWWWWEWWWRWWWWLWWWWWWFKQVKSFKPYFTEILSVRNYLWWWCLIVSSPWQKVKVNLKIWFSKGESERKFGETESNDGNKI